MELFDEENAIKYHSREKSKKTLAAEYDCNASTIRRWCIKLNLTTDKSDLSRFQVAEIYRQYGLPAKLWEEYVTMIFRAKQKAS